MTEQNPQKQPEINTLGEQEWLDWIKNRPAIEIAKMLDYQSERARLAGIDALTGLKNRDGVQFLLPHLRAEAVRQKLNIEFVFLDLDNFKKINDEQGHLAGDAMLIDAAGRIQRAVRGTDLVARWGGDEFLAIGLVRPNDDTDILGNRIRSSLKGQGNEKPIKASVGNLQLKPEDNFDMAIDTVDRRMYIEKSNHRK